MPAGPYVDTSDGCTECRKRHFRFDRVIRLGVYEDSLRAACIRGKSSGGTALAAALAALLWNKQLAQFVEFKPDVIVAVPQFWLQWLTRPHHQAVTIAEVLAERLQTPFCNRLVRKVRNTVDQSSLPESERLRNLTDAFQTRRNTQLKDRRVLLVDDILTTGTTANEIARVIRKAEASKVAVAVIAVVP